MIQPHVVLLGEVCRFLNGGTPSTSIPEYFQGNIPWITGADITSSVVCDARTFITPLAIQSSATNQVSAGTVLLVTRTSVGKVAIAGVDLCFSQDITAITPNANRLDAAYLVRFLQTQQTHLERLARGATIKGIPRDVVEALSIPLPPLPDQRRIAAILDKADELRAKRRTALEQLNGLTQAIFLEMFGDPATNPRGFDRRTLGELIAFEGGSQPPRYTFTYEPSPDAIRFVQIRDFKTDAFKTYIPRRLARRFLNADDIMIGRYGPPLFQILRGLSGSYNVALIKAVPKPGVSKDFIFHLLQEQRLHAYVIARSERTAGQTGVNLELLQRYPAYLPPECIQQEFARRAGLVGGVTAMQKESAFTLEALFGSLQHRAFAGGL